MRVVRHDHVAPRLRHRSPRLGHVDGDFALAGLELHRQDKGGAREHFPLADVGLAGGLEEQARADEGAGDEEVVALSVAGAMGGGVEAGEGAAPDQAGADGGFDGAEGVEAALEPGRNPSRSRSARREKLPSVTTRSPG